MPMTEATAETFRQKLQDIRDAGTYKEERVITSQQDADIEVESGDHVINFCANNYLGLANHPEIMGAAKKGVDRYGFGVASVRFHLRHAKCPQRPGARPLGLSRDR